MPLGAAAFLAPPPPPLARRRHPRAAPRCAAARAGAAAAAPAVAGFGSRVRGVAYELTKTVLPADSDYSGALWHGAYVRWLEEARVRYFGEVGIDYAALVREERLELVVTRLEVRYVRAARLGDVVTVRQALDAARSSRVRLLTVSQFVRLGEGGAEELVAEAEVAVTPVAVDTGRVARRWPARFEDAICRLFEGGGDDVPEMPAWLARR